MSAEEKTTESAIFERDQSFDSVNIVVAHHESIRKWSNGEVGRVLKIARSDF